MGLKTPILRYPEFHIKTEQFVHFSDDEWNFLPIGNFSGTNGYIFTYETSRAARAKHSEVRSAGRPPQGAFRIGLLDASGSNRAVLSLLGWAPIHK